MLINPNSKYLLRRRKRCINRKNIEDKNEYDYWIEWYRKLASKQNETIQALKKSHPEFSK